MRDLPIKSHAVAALPISRCIVAIFIGLLTCAAYLHTNQRPGKAIFSEDGLIEWASAGLFAFAAVIAFLMVITRRQRDIIPVVICGLSAMCFLDEISFGARFFDWSMPPMPGGGQLDGVHDLVILGIREAEALPMAIPSIGFGFLALAATIFISRHGQMLGTVWILNDWQRMLVTAAVGALTFAVLLDLVERRWAEMIEEIAELSAAAALAFAVTTWPQTAAPRTLLRRLTGAPVQR